MKIHFVMHEGFETPAAIESWAQSKGHRVSYTRLYAGEKLPENSNDIDFLVVMGGPQSPATTTDECPYFDAKKEIALIKDAVGRKKLILGICLGAQLIGEAYGARFEHSPNKEVGVFPIYLTDAGTRDPIFSRFPASFPVGHWHGDMPGIAGGAELLAFSEGCPRQIVRYDRNVYGFQCHLEFTREAIEGMIENCPGDIAKARTLPYIQDAETIRTQDFASFNYFLYQFLDYMETKVLKKSYSDDMAPTI